MTKDDRMRDRLQKLLNRVDSLPPPVPPSEPDADSFGFGFSISGGMAGWQRDFNKHYGQRPPVSVHYQVGGDLIPAFRGTTAWPVYRVLFHADGWEPEDSFEFRGLELEHMIAWAKANLGRHPDEEEGVEIDGKLIFDHGNNEMTWRSLGAEYILITAIVHGTIEIDELRQWLNDPGHFGQKVPVDFTEALVFGPWPRLDEHPPFVAPIESVTVEVPNSPHIRWQDNELQVTPTTITLPNRSELTEAWEASRTSQRRDLH